jgi:DNA-binding MarR family transcriptional regulator
MSCPQIDSRQGPDKPVASLNMLDAKLWDNPCPFSFRLNYLALLYNTPLYSWVQDTYGLKRPEYVVLYSLAVANGGGAHDISRTSGFPKNTLSRAIKRIELLGLIEPRCKAPGGGRKQTLRLSDKGWALFNRTRPAFEAQEKKMLKTLSVGEQQILSELMSKIVIGSEDWAGELPPEAMIDTETWTEGKTQ